ncbi:sulfotransferase [Marinicella rhabdoformis]|uniref:sulfotransferase n=1 Tax=Marinicella rhabdoformis TaxID=2580566 RepID=UPI0012AECF65|nr:sulfotransferase [Marinicella rhabdoformis]
MTASLTKNKIEEICRQITPDHISGVESFVVFLGHAHSGHSLIGALLDSHPRAAITNEINVAKLLVDHDLNSEQTLSLLLSTSFENQHPDAWNNTGYSYKTTTGFQGNTTHPLVIGDKKGGGNTRIIKKNPQVLERLHKLFGGKLKFIQVIRNPYDNIAAFSHYWQEPINIKHVERYFENLETTQFIESTGIGSFYKLDYTSFMQNPKLEYTNLLKFVELEINEELINLTLKIVNKTEHKRAKKYDWPPDILAAIEKNIKIFNY